MDKKEQIAEKQFKKSEMKGMERKDFVKAFKNAVGKERVIRLNNTSAFYASDYSFFKTTDGVMRIHIFSEEREIGYCDLDDVMEVF